MISENFMKISVDVNIFVICRYRPATLPNTNFADELQTLTSPHLTAPFESSEINFFKFDYRELNRGVEKTFDLQ